jgi:hypothetical protein
MGSTIYDGTLPAMTGPGAVTNLQVSRRDWPRDDVA